jgi:peptidoglycan/LPS O-acetylase OafA/YrhL
MSEMPLESTAGARRPRLTGIEGLRGVAASSILVYHVWLYGAPSALPFRLDGPLTKLMANLLAGVTLFFVLSGFLLFRPFAAALLRGSALPSIRSYLRNRALRILPAYWFVLLVVAVAFHRELLARPLQLLANALFLQDYVRSYMPVANGGIGIVPAWSLCIEVVFYLLLPLLAFAAARLRRLAPWAQAASAPAALLAVGVLGKVLARVALPGGMWDAGFPVHADWFAFGMLVAILRVRWEEGKLARPRPAAVRALAVLALLIIAVAVELFDHGRLGATEYQTPIALAFAILLGLLVVGGERTRVARMLASRPLQAAGLVSYSVFLWHDPLLRALRGAGATVGGAGGAFVVDVLLLAAVTAACSAATYLWIERPALARKAGVPAADETARPRRVTARQPSPAVPVEPAAVD